MEPVSRFLEGGMESAYYDIKYRPNGGMSKMDIACSSLLTYMAIADITRNEDQIDNLTDKFCEILLMCKTQEDFINFKSFMDMTSRKGGYAVEFYNKLGNLISQNGKNKVQKFIENQESQEYQEKSSDENLEEFKKNYARLNMDLSELKNNSVIDDEEVALLLKKYNKLQSDLYNFNGIINKEYISQCDEEIEKAITYLKGLYQSLDDLKTSTRGF